jgi:hypothetical protein
MTTNECGFTLVLASKDGSMILKNGESIDVDYLEYKVSYEDGSGLQMFYNDTPHTIIWSDRVESYIVRDGYVIAMTNRLDDIDEKIVMLGDKHHQLDTTADYLHANSHNTKIFNESGDTLMIGKKKVKNGCSIRIAKLDKEHIDVKGVGFSTILYRPEIVADLYIVASESTEKMYYNLPETHYNDAFVMRKRPIIMEYSLYPKGSMVLAITSRVAIVRPMTIDEYNDYNKSSIPWGLVLAMIIVIIVATVIIALSVAGAAMKISKNKFDLAQ